LFNLSNKISLVTGGAGNYGKCIVEGLLESGSKVIVSSRNPESAEIELIEYFGSLSGIEVMPLDQQNLESIDSLIKTIKDKYGKIDVFVNNAVSRPMKGYFGNIEEFRESMEVNGTGMFYLLRLITELMVENKGGSVISIASMMGMKGPDYSNYEGTQMGDLPPDYFFHNAGLINLNRFMCKRFAGKNIRFNCISPGGLFNHQHDQFLKNYCQKVPLGRMANSDDIKGLIVLLASKAGEYINGENILMDGGLNA
ncbi:SDR family oxidoreductase, partial [Sphingobacterium daejeonense]